jgi:hypothetical protein
MLFPSPSPDMASIGKIEENSIHVYLCISLLNVEKLNPSLVTLSFYFGVQKKLITY